MYNITPLTNWFIEKLEHHMPTHECHALASKLATDVVNASSNEGVSDGEFIFWTGVKPITGEDEDATD